jgi:hypothetical protein
MKERVLGVVVPICLLLAGTARAQALNPLAPPGPPVAGLGPNGFGAPGQVTIASDFGISFIHYSDAEFSELVLEPALDYFIAPNLSVGGKVRFDYSKNKGGSTSALGVGPRVGYQLPLADMFSVFPKLGFFLEHVSSSVSGGASSGYTLFSLTIDVPFLWHPVPHFFIGIGPTLFANIAGATSAQRDVQFGLVSTVGGFFDW